MMSCHFFRVFCKFLQFKSKKRRFTQNLLNCLFIVVKLSKDLELFDNTTKGDFMEFPEQLSTRITAAIASQLKDYSEEKLEEINYGIAVFIANSYKMLIIFILAAVMDVFKYFLVALMSFGLLRSFASGVHAKHEWTCLPSSILLFSGIIYVGKAITLDIYSISIIYAVCFVVILLYSPADTEERPIVSVKLRKKLKVMSCITLLLLYFFSLLLLSTPFSSIAALSALSESVLIIPITYRLTGSMYGTGMKINKKMEVRK